MRVFATLTTLAAVIALAAPVGAAGMADKTSGQQQGQQAQQQASKRGAEAGVVGLDVVTEQGNRIGKIVGTIERENTPNDVIVELEKENYQMGVVREDPEKMARNAADEDVLAGGTTVAVPHAHLRRSEDGDAMIVDDVAYTTIQDMQRKMDNAARNQNR